MRKHSLSSAPVDSYEIEHVLRRDGFLQREEEPELSQVPEHSIADGDEGMPLMDVISRSERRLSIPQPAEYVGQHGTYEVCVIVDEGLSGSIQGCPAATGQSCLW